MANKKINSNGFEYVDLDLPSGTLWATCNVGASKASDAGLYFQWGDTVGYTADQVGIEDEQKKFASYWSDYKFETRSKFTKYNGYGATLELEDDAAHVNMGGDWHMPTPSQIQELLDNTTSTWATFDDVNGILFTSKKDDSKFIFIPEAGYAWDGSVHGSGNYGNVWSSMLSTGDVGYGQYLYFVSGNVGLGSSSRYSGFSVRGVIDKKHDNFKNKKSNMNENLNLVEILKDAPKGTKLWSPICGDCELDKIDTRDTVGNYAIYCLAVNDHSPVRFTANGKYTLCYDDGECVLFPSKENRDWSTFKMPNVHKHFESYQKVLMKEYCDGKCRWTPDFYSYYCVSLNRHYLVGTGWAKDEDIIPYEGNEDKVGKVVE